MKIVPFGQVGTAYKIALAGVECAAAPRESEAWVTSVSSNAAKAAIRIKASFFIPLVLRFVLWISRKKFHQLCRFSDV